MEKVEKLAAARHMPFLSGTNELRMIRDVPAGLILSRSSRTLVKFGPRVFCSSVGPGCRSVRSERQESYRDVLMLIDRASHHGLTRLHAMSGHVLQTVKRADYS